MRKLFRGSDTRGSDVANMVARADDTLRKLCSADIVSRKLFFCGGNPVPYISIYIYDHICV